jgi:hypothetical protein
MRISHLHFWQLSIVATVALIAVPVYAQNASTEELTIQLTSADRSAAQAAKMGTPRAYPANNAAGQALRARQFAERSPASDRSGSTRGAILLDPLELTNEGGRVVTSAVSHAIYLQRQTGAKCSIAACWGDPEGFLRDFGQSDFIHVIDQYVGQSGGNRYTVGFHATVMYTPPVGPITDLAAIVHAVAAKTGLTGYGHIYHIFLPPGQDECYALAANYCYSPDNPATFVYCSYHNSVDFPDIGHVIYTIQPYVNVPGCQVQPGTHNGTLIDSTDNVLGHETFETITDPDFDGWRNTSGGFNLNNLEVADECQFVTFLGGLGYDDVPTLLIGAHIYAVQLVYSNDQHACSSAPSRGRP